MTKAELIDHIAQQNELTKARAAEVLESLNNAILTGLTKGKEPREFTLPGLGKFSVTKVKARQGRNPSTGEAIKIPASKRVKFTPAKAVKDLVNKK